MKCLLSACVILALLSSSLLAAEPVTNPFPALNIVVAKHTCAHKFPDLKERLDAAFRRFAELNVRHYSTEQWKELDTGMVPLNELEAKLTREACEDHISMLLGGKFDDMQDEVELETSRNLEVQRLIEASNGHPSGIGARLEADPRKGTTLLSVEPGSPAAKAGLQSGDVILEIDGQKVASTNDLRLKVLRISPGTTVVMAVLRKGTTLKVPVTVVRLGGK